MNNGLAGYGPKITPPIPLAPMALPRPNRWTTLWPTAASATAASPGNNFLFLLPITAMGRIVETAIECTSAVASSVAAVGVYTDRNGAPADRAATLLTADMSSTGIKQAPSVFNFGDVPTNWWVGWVIYGGATGAATRNSLPSCSRASGVANNESGLLESGNLTRYGVVVAAGALPDAINGTPLGTGWDKFIHLVVRWAP